MLQWAGCSLPTRHLFRDHFSKRPICVEVHKCRCCRHAVDLGDSYRSSIMHDSDDALAAGPRFSRNVPLRRTVHTVPMSVYQSPAANQGAISPASTPQSQCANFHCGTASRSHGQPSFFGRLAAKFGRKR